MIWWPYVRLELRSSCRCGACFPAFATIVSINIWGRTRSIDQRACHWSIDISPCHMPQSNQSSKRTVRSMNFRAVHDSSIQSLIIVYGVFKSSYTVVHQYLDRSDKLPYCLRVFARSVDSQGIDHRQLIFHQIVAIQVSKLISWWHKS